MKIDDLVANLERNAQEQDRAMSEKIKSVTTQHLASYNELLNSSLKTTESIMKKHQETMTASINQHQVSLRESLNQTLINRKLAGIIAGIVYGSGGMLFIVLAILNWTAYRNLNNMKDQVAEMQSYIQTLPSYSHALMQMEIGVDDRGRAWVQPKYGWTWTVGTNKLNNRPLAIINKD